MATIEEMANQIIKQEQERKAKNANKTAGVQDTSAVKSAPTGTGSTNTGYTNTGSTVKKKQSVEEMANQVIKQAREYKAAHPVTNTATTAATPAVKPYVSYADYGQGLLDRVNETEDRAMKLGSLLERAPAIISNQDQTLKKVETEADSVFKSGVWRTNPLVAEMYKGLYDQRNMTAEKLETMRSAYNRLVTDAQKAREDYLTAVEEYNGFYGFNGDNDDSEDFRLGSGAAWDEWRGSIRAADVIQPELQEAQKKVKALTEQTERERAEINAHADDFAYTNGGVETPEFTARRQALAEKERELEAAKKRADTLQEEANFSKYLKWETLRSNGDFAEKSAYTPKEGWKGEYYDKIGRYLINDEDAFEYEYVNKNPDAWMVSRVNGAQDYSTFMGTDRSFRKEMEPEEVSMYNYVFATQGADKAKEYLQDLETSLTARQRDEETKELRKAAKADRLGSSVFSVIMSPMKTVSYIGQVADYMQDGSIDQNAGYNKFSYANSAIRDEVAKKWGKVGSFLYQTGMSMADFVYTTAISGGFGNKGNEAARKAAESISLAIMGTSAAADSVIEAKDRGLSDNQAFALGTIAGLAEVVTEKVSLETLLNGTKWSKSAVGYFLANTIAEGSEESASDLINWAADVLIAQDQSQWREDIRKIKEEHPDWSEDRAFGEALKNKAAEIGLDALGGALSGGVMAIPGSARMATSSRTLGSGIQMGGMDAVQALIEEGKSYGPKTPAAKLAAELQSKISSGGTPTKAELGYLEIANGNAAEEQRARQEKEERRTARKAAETPQNAGTPQSEQNLTNRPETATATSEAAEAPSESVSGAAVENPAMSTETGNEELTLAERKIMLEKRESAFRERGNKYLEAVNRGKDTGDMGNELNREAAAIEEERRAIEAEEQERELRARNEELSARQRALTVAPTGRQIQERQERAGNLRELERSGRESGATEEQIETARRISNATGRKIVFVRENSTKRGYYQSGTIYVNAARGNETEQIIAHELTHSIEDSNLYGDFSRLVQQRIQETTGDLEARLDEITDRYAASGVELKNDADVMKEVVAEYVERELLTNEESITSLVKENRSLGRRILDLLDKLLAKLRIKGAKERAFVQSARDLYARALVETRSEVDTQAALDEARIALGSGEISDEEFDRIYDALGVGIEEAGGGQYSFAGVNARDANPQTLAHAQQMERAGESVRAIRMETGWFRGMDDKWRFEIDDSGMRYNRAGDNVFRNGNPHYQELAYRLSNGEELTEAELRELWRLDDLRADMMSMKKSDGLTLADYITHDELFRSYPQLRNVKLTFRKLENGKQGNYNYASNTIVLDEGLREAPEDTLIHELQHAIQNIEGFTPGANSEYWALRNAETGGEIAKRIQNQYRDVLNGLSREDLNRYLRYEDMEAAMERAMNAEEGSKEAKQYERYEAEQDRLYEELYEKPWFHKLQKLRNLMDSPRNLYMNLYKNTAGEVEAREVETRRKLTAQERRETEPNLDRTEAVFAEDFQTGWSKGDDAETMSKKGQIEEKRYSISRDEIQTIQNIGRKSVNDFSSQEIEQTEGFARRYWQEMGTKSPFFRAWFGDWRANDKTPVQVVKVSSDATYKAGRAVNNDTGRTISWGSDFQRETRVHQRSGGIAGNIVGNIESLVKYAVLLDTETSERSSKTKLPGTAFMHSFYALAREADGRTSIMKLYAEEAISEGGNPFTRAYELKDIEKVAVTANGVLSAKGGLTEAATTTNISVADLFDAVKRYDKEFNPKPASKVVDEDGKPLVVYHGTDAEFTVFDAERVNSREPSGDYVGKGFYFADTAGKARRYGSKVIPAYLSLTNPLIINTEADAKNFRGTFLGMYKEGKEDLREILGGDYDYFSIMEENPDAIRRELERRGYDGLIDNLYGQYATFKPEQIKLAEGNRGTFDRANPDIRYSIASDSVGRSLSADQREYFKDSVVRDEQGRLKVMYHGTSSGGFTVFDGYGKGRFGLFGLGNYFTDNKQVAEGYQNKGRGSNRQVYEVYLNVTNPLDMDAKANVNAWIQAVPDAREYFDGKNTNEDCFRALTEFCADEEMIRGEAEELINDAIQWMGHDGITHIGGGRFGTKNGPRHRVYITFTPEQVKNVTNSTPTNSGDIRYSIDAPDDADSGSGTETKNSQNSWEVRKDLNDYIAESEGYPVINGVRLHHGQWVLVQDEMLDEAGDPLVDDDGNPQRYHNYGMVVGMARDGKVRVHFWNKGDGKTKSTRRCL